MKPPAPKIAIVTCADPRLTDIEQMLGLAHADVDMIRRSRSRRPGHIRGSRRSFLPGGFVYEVSTGRLSEVFADRETGNAS